MEWIVTYTGSMELPDLHVDAHVNKPDLTEEAIAGCKEIRKQKKNEPRASLRMFVDSDSLQGTPVGSGQPFYQPIGRVIFVHAHTERGMKKSHHVTVIATAEGSVFGSPNSKYICHTFKCKTEDDSNAVAYAAHRTMMTSAKRQRPEQGIAGADPAEVDESIKWWNSCNTPLYHFNLDKQSGAVSGNLMINCQVDSSLRTAKKVVRLSTNDCGSTLVQLLGDKFNLGEINHDDYAVFEHRESGEQVMLSEDESPVAVALKRADPCEGTFWLRRVPQGLVRATKRSSDSAPRMETTTPNTVDNSPEKNVSSLQSQLGPELPYHEADEDLLLSVMIAKQSGSGLGFKLTPAYLLQMCISYCAVQRGPKSLGMLLSKISQQISAVLDGSQEDAEMLLFWAVNTIKLLETLSRAPITSEAFDLDHFAQILDRTLDGLVEMRAEDKELPRALTKTEWSSKPELRTIVTQYCHTIEQNMNRDSLNDVVQRITQAISNPRSGATPQKPSDPHNITAPTGFQMETPPAAPRTSTPITKTLEDMDGNPYNPNETATSTDGPEEESFDGHVEPLPEEWEELLDQDTKHRFFANHVTRETSWTDPRDKLSTVTLVKGDKGLGLGISGAKHTYDNRLVLGIFVSSLVPGSAAATEGSLREGDEILEVNGRSLIGVSREEAIEELKRVRHNEQVVLLVSQEPRRGDRNKYRHTAL